MPETGRVVLVTGGANGIGWATARRFAQAGDQVAIADLDAAACAARADELGAGHLAIAADLGRAADCVAMVEGVLRRYGRLDVLVNNAGRIDPRAMPALEQDEGDFRALLAVNLHGTYVVAREAASAMTRQGDGGAIVNTASGAGIVAVPLRNAYGASKGAVVGLSRRMAGEWARHGIRVNAVAPGYIRTEMVESLVRAGKVDIGRVERRIPLGRLGTPDEVAAVTCHLASDGAAGLNGVLWVADGGYLAFGGTGDASAPGAARPAPSMGPRVVAIAGGAPAIADALSRSLAGPGDLVEVVDWSETAVRALAERSGGIDVLVTLAPRAGSPDYDAGQLDDAVAGTFLVCRAAAASMLARGGGSMVNVIRDPAGAPSMAGDACAGGIAMLTRSLACEWAGGGLRVNALRAEADTPPGHLAGTVRFLASADASYVTGSVIDQRRPVSLALTPGSLP